MEKNRWKNQENSCDMCKLQGSIFFTVVRSGMSIFWSPKCLEIKRKLMLRYIFRLPNFLKVFCFFKKNYQCLL